MFLETAEEMTRTPEPGKFYCYSSQTLHEPAGISAPFLPDHVAMGESGDKHSSSLMCSNFFTQRKKKALIYENWTGGGGGSKATGTISTTASINVVPEGTREEECGGNGYCGYKSVAYILWGNKSRYGDVIEDIIDFLVSRESFFHFFKSIGTFHEQNDLTLSSYINELRNSLVWNEILPEHLWLNEMGVQVISMVYNLNVIILYKPAGQDTFFFLPVLWRRSSYVFFGFKKSRKLTLEGCCTNNKFESLSRNKGASSANPDEFCVPRF
jgi:hypothetical protein